MSEWQARRFWTGVAVIETETGLAITLDGRQLRTPSGTVMELPTRELSERIRQEWSSQGEVVDPATMPFTRLANVAIDRIDGARGEVIDVVAGYAGSDLLCHRAEQPDELVARQRDAWDPVLDWASSELGVQLKIGTGIMPVQQGEESLSLLRAEIRRLDRFALAGLTEMVSLTGSLLLGLTVLHGYLKPEAAWQMSLVDEHYQAGKWGVDREAANAEMQRMKAFLVAGEFAGAGGRTVAKACKDSTE